MPAQSRFVKFSLLLSLALVVVAMLASPAAADQGLSGDHLNLAVRNHKRMVKVYAGARRATPEDDDTTKTPNAGKTTAASPATGAKAAGDSTTVNKNAQGQTNNGQVGIASTDTTRNSNAADEGGNANGTGNTKQSNTKANKQDDDGGLFGGLFGSSSSSVQSSTTASSSATDTASNSASVTGSASASASTTGSASASVSASSASASSESSALPSTSSVITPSETPTSTQPLSTSTAFVYASNTQPPLTPSQSAVMANNLAVNHKVRVSLGIFVGIGAAVVAVSLMWTLFRKWKLAPSKAFAERTAPIDWQPTTYERDETMLEKQQRRRMSGGSFRSLESSSHGHENMHPGAPPHDFTAGPSHLAVNGGYADLQRGRSPSPAPQMMYQQQSQGYYPGSREGY